MKKLTTSTAIPTYALKAEALASAAQLAEAQRLASEWKRRSEGRGGRGASVIPLRAARPKLGTPS